jgi:LysM repeat protein
MSDRGVPVVDGAPACPFVAFDDDRDARSTAPDHRHRCFAEPNPAPRALAHQDAYCLSPAFAVCPAFQDWARREAAAARQAPPTAAGRAIRDARETTSLPVPMSRGGAPIPVEDDGRYDDVRYDDAGDDEGEVDDGRDADRYAPPTAADRDAGSRSEDPVPPLSPRRQPAREWAAPPPWLDEDPAAPSDRWAPPASPAKGAIPGWGATAGGAAGAAGLAAGAGAATPGGSRAGSGVSRVPGRVRGDDDAWASSSRGLAGSAADRLAGPDPDAPQAARPQRSYAPPPVPADDLDDEAWNSAPPFAPERERHPGGGLPPRGGSSANRPAPDRRPGPRGEGRSSARDGARPQSPREAGELFGPAWEQPRRYEAYPSLRTRMGLPSFAGLPRIGVAALAVVAAAIILFLVGPMLLGLGGKSPGAGTATPSPTASAQPSVSEAPTLAPAPTSQTYTVVAGDTMSKIAAKFGVTLTALRAANPQVKNVNSIKIGDLLTIPAPPVVNGDGGSGTVGGASPSPLPSPS